MLMVCFVLFQDEMTPLNHISQGSGGSNEKLLQLLQKHNEKQRKQKALEICSNAKTKMEEFEMAMSNIVGLQDLKLQLYKWAKGMIMDERRRALGLTIAPRKLPHMAFLGSPGTGMLYKAYCNPKTYLILERTNGCLKDCSEDCLHDSLLTGVFLLI